MKENFKNLIAFVARIDLIVAKLEKKEEPISAGNQLVWDTNEDIT